MALLKEDGSLNMEWLGQLPIEEFIKVFGRLTREQVNEFWSRIPINESKGPTRPVMVDYTLEDEIARGTAVDAVDFLNKQREKYGTKR